MNTESTSIFHSLLEKIKDGKLAPGDSVPKETELAKHHQTSRMNAHWAMRELESNGLVVRKKHVGTFVSENINTTTVIRLFNESSTTIRVLYSTNPRRIHWDETSFTTLEEIVKPAGFDVDYHTIPDSGQRDDLAMLIRKLEEIGSKALVIFPDTPDMHFLIANKDLISKSVIPTYVLNRTGAPMPFTNVSDVSMDPLGEGARMGAMLREHTEASITFLGEKNEFWSQKRYEGIILGLTDEKGTHPNVEVITTDNKKALVDLRERIVANPGKMVVVAANNAVAGTMANAIYNAVGIRFKETPITSERVLRVLISNGGKKGGNNGKH